MKILLKLSLLIISLLVLSITLIPDANACTRVVYKGLNGTIITARSMDWKDKIPANIWIFPRGMQRNGEAGSNSLTWTSKYGSIIASSWDIAVTNGMNEKGLVANALWLTESKYPEFDINGNQKGLTISAWAQYALDNFATVDEAVTELRKEEFVIVSENIPGTDRFTALHLALSDATGDNAIFEYIDGKLVIHHNPSYQVMTNSPTFEKQLAINTYWEGIPGSIMLPGTNRAADRFVRASYYIHAIPQTDNTRVAVASVLSVIKKHSEERFLVPSSDIHKQTMFKLLDADKINYSNAVIYRTVASNLSDVEISKYDLVIFFSPAGIKSLQNNFPDYEQNDKLIAAFGPTTAKAVKEAGLKLSIPAPTQSAPSMTMAIDEYLTKQIKERRRNGRK